MSLVLLLLLLQPPGARALLEIEYNRAEDVAPLLKALKSQDAQLQKRAARTAGRLERPSLRDAVVPLLGSSDPGVRREAVAALAQMGARFDFGALIAAEKDSSVRAVIYEALGRDRPVRAGSEALLAASLQDKDPLARTGAARGLEWLIRLNIKAARPEPSTVAALREAVRNNQVSDLRQAALLALNLAGDSDEETLGIALRDEDPQVRRLAVVGSKRWVEDPSPMVRLEAMLFGSCERAFAAIQNDPSGHVVLAAVDRLGKGKCDPKAIGELVEHGRDWRVRSRALVSLARVAPEAARARLPSFAADSVFQVRVYAANAASISKAEAVLAALARDPDPNVAAAALTTFEDALRALSSDHSGLLLAAAEKLSGGPALKGAAPRILATIQRLSRTGQVTVRDPRVRLIEVLGEAADPNLIEELRPLLADRDPVVAALVARVLTEKTGKAATVITTVYRPEPLPSETTLASLEGARAVMVMKGLGSLTLELLPEEAPATVATFVDLAEKGAYDGLTFHRVAPNFVLQGGSPGADEYDALTPQFMRDELGLTSHRRGTLGISTRGHDTGDGQIFINLIDNWRLDHTYTVFARVTSGMEVVDRILEGDVMESVRILGKRH